MKPKPEWTQASNGSWDYMADGVRYGTVEPDEANPGQFYWCALETSPAEAGNIRNGSAETEAWAKENVEALVHLWHSVVVV